MKDVSMKIYISHSREFDFKKHLYDPIKQSSLYKNHEVILPHDASNAPWAIQSALQCGDIDLIIAEVSYPSTGQGIELAWAHAAGVAIVCVSEHSKKISGSLKMVTDIFVTYYGHDELLSGVLLGITTATQMD